MYENPLPLERYLEKHLGALGILFGKRITGKELSTLAAEDDEVNRMLGCIAREDIKNMPPVKRLFAAMFELSGLQRELLQNDEERGFSIIFRGIAYRSPWRLEYEAAQNAGHSKVCEMVCPDYRSLSFLMVCDGYSDESTLVDVDMTADEINMLPKEIQYLVEKLSALNKKPFILKRLLSVLLAFSD